MRQQTLASQASFEKFGRKGKRELFLDQMEQVVPCAAGSSCYRPRIVRSEVIDSTATRISATWSGRSRCGTFIVRNCSVRRLRSSS